MASADFSQFVVTTANDSARETSPLKVRTLFPHLPATFTGTSGNFGASSLLADLPIFPSLICDSCPSGQGFAYSFLQIPPHDGHPTVQLCASSLPTRTRDLHPLEPAHGGRTKKGYCKILIPADFRCVFRGKHPKRYHRVYFTTSLSYYYFHFSCITYDWIFWKKKTFLFSL